MSEESDEMFEGCLCPVCGGFFWKSELQPFDAEVTTSSNNETEYTLWEVDMRRAEK
jgi:hypothetical protein